MVAGENGCHGVHVQWAVGVVKKQELGVVIAHGHQMVVPSVLLMDQKTRNLDDAMKINVLVGTRFPWVIACHKNYMPDIIFDIIWNSKYNSTCLQHVLSASFHSMVVLLGMVSHYMLLLWRNANLIATLIMSVDRFLTVNRKTFVNCPGNLYRLTKYWRMATSFAQREVYNIASIMWICIQLCL